MFKKPFNSKVGEQRECKICKEQFHATRPVWRCKPCIGKINFENAKKKYGEGIVPTGKWAGMKAKEKYPFDNRGTEASNRFATIRKKLRKAWEGGREDITKHYDNQLNEIKENGILEWILDRRSDSDKKDGEAKSKKKIHIEYPNTRDMPYE
jgi:hypothetical protein